MKTETLKNNKTACKPLRVNHTQPPQIPSPSTSPPQSSYKSTTKHTTQHTKMAKHTLLLTIFTLFLITTTKASTYRATITIDDENPHHTTPRDCDRQIKQQDSLKPCQMYLASRLQQSPYEGPEHEVQLQQCCQLLQQLRQPCRCAGVETAARISERRQGRLSGQQKRQLYQMAAEITQLCDVEPRTCGFGSSFDM